MILILKIGEAEKVLNLSRPTIMRLLRTGELKAEKLPNKYWAFDEKSVYAYLHKDNPRQTVLYGRVSGSERKPELDSQIEQLKQFAFNRGMTVNAVYSDISDGVSFDKRKGFLMLLDEIIAGRISTIIVSHKDRLGRTGFEPFARLFDFCGVELITISDIASAELDKAELFTDISALLKQFSIDAHLLTDEFGKKAVIEISN